MNLLLCALGAFFVVEVLKQSKVLFPVKDWWKPWAALVASTGISAFFYRHHPYDLAAYGLAGAGLALLTHKLYRMFSTIGDRAVVEILNVRAPQRPR